MMSSSENTCSMEIITTGEEAQYDCLEHVMYCHNCFTNFGFVSYNEDSDVWMDELPNYCPHCGARVVSKDA